MSTPTPGDAEGKGVFKCLALSEHCQVELYDYGPITNDYPNFPVMTDARWCIVNKLQQNNGHNNSAHNVQRELQRLLHQELKDAYCGSRRLPAKL